jgi:hypothetical protein
MAGAAVCASRGLGLPLTPPAAGPNRTWIPKGRRPSWHPDDCTSPCCGVWRPAPRSNPVPTDGAATTTATGQVRCDVCGLPVSSEYVARTGRTRHGNHRDPNEEAAA